MKRSVIAQKLHTVRVLLVTYYAYMLEYRAELVLWALSGLLPFILMGAWMQAAESGAAVGRSAVEFARYFLAAFVARQLSLVWVIFEFEKEVLQGKLSPRLLQPLDPGWHHLLSHIAERVARLPAIAGLVGIFFLLYPQAFWVPSLGQLAAFLGVSCLAFGLRFLMQYTLAMAAFWTERATAIEQVWFLFYLFGSGVIAPLDLFPESVRAIVDWSPFPYVIYFPAALLLGWPVNWGQGCLAMGLWSGFFWLLGRWLWRRGLRQYSGMGA